MDKNLYAPHLCNQTQLACETPDFPGEDCRDSSQEKTPTREPRPDTEHWASDPRDAINEASERDREAGDTHQDQTARISLESDEPALVKPENLGEQEQFDPYPGKEDIPENLTEKDKTEQGIENLQSESQDSDRTAEVKSQDVLDCSSEKSDTLENISEDISQDVCEKENTPPKLSGSEHISPSLTESGPESQVENNEQPKSDSVVKEENPLLDINKVDTVVEIVENTEPEIEEAKEEQRLVSEEPEELPDLEEVPDIAMVPVSVEETLSAEVQDSSDAFGIGNGQKSIEDQMLVPRWDRAPSTSSQEDLPEPPSDFELGEIRHELPTPPQDEELQLIVQQHHDLPPPPPEVFGTLLTEDLPIPQMDSDSDVPLPPLPPPSASEPQEPYAKNAESKTGTSDDGFLPTEQPSELSEPVTVESKMAATVILKLMKS